MASGGDFASPLLLQQQQLAAIQAARNLQNEQAALTSQQPASHTTPDPEKELHQFSGGEIADLAMMHLQTRNHNNTPTPYDPIDPFQLQESQIPPPVEVGRLQTKLYSLKAKLNGA